METTRVLRGTRWESLTPASSSTVSQIYCFKTSYLDQQKHLGIIPHSKYYFTWNLCRRNVFVLNRFKIQQFIWTLLFVSVPCVVRPCSVVDIDHDCLSSRPWSHAWRQQGRPVPPLLSMPPADCCVVVPAQVLTHQPQVCQCVDPPQTWTFSPDKKTGNRENTFGLHFSFFSALRLIVEGRTMSRCQGWGWAGN